MILVFYQRWLCQVQFQKAAVTFLPEPQAGCEAWAWSISLRTDQVKIKDKNPRKRKVTGKDNEGTCGSNEKGERNEPGRTETPKQHFYEWSCQGKELQREGWILLPCDHLLLWT